MIDVNHLEPNVTYVMVKYEGSVFPGLLKVVGKVSAIFSCMIHVPSQHAQVVVKVARGGG